MMPEGRSASSSAFVGVAASMAIIVLLTVLYLTVGDVSLAIRGQQTPSRDFRSSRNDHPHGNVYTAPGAQPDRLRRGAPHDAAKTHPAGASWKEPTPRRRDGVPLPQVEKEYRHALVRVRTLLHGRDASSETHKAFTAKVERVTTTVDALLADERRAADVSGTAAVALGTQVDALDAIAQALERGDATSTVPGTETTEDAAADAPQEQQQQQKQANRPCEMQHPVDLPPEEPPSDEEDDDGFCAADGPASCA